MASQPDRIQIYLHGFQSSLQYEVYSQICFMLPCCPEHPVTQWLSFWLRQAICSQRTVRLEVGHLRLRINGIGFWDMRIHFNFEIIKIIQCYFAGISLVENKKLYNWLSGRNIHRLTLHVQPVQQNAGTAKHPVLYGWESILGDVIPWPVVASK